MTETIIAGKNVNRTLRQGQLLQVRCRMRKRQGLQENFCMNIQTVNFAIIDAEIKELEGIIALFDELTRAKNVILADDVKIAYRKFLKCQKTLEEASRNMEIATRRIAEDYAK